MGVDIISEAILGVAVKRSDLFEIKKSKAFDHNYSDLNWIYDPKSGKRLWNEERISRLEDCKYYISSPENRGLLDSNSPDDDFIICMMCARTGSHRDSSNYGNINFNDTSFIELYNKLKEYILSKNLPFNFGLYAVTTY